jgi:hypothetical protein
MALALEGEGRVAGDHEAVADAREIGGQVLGYAVGEIVLGRVAGQVGEGQYDDGKMRGFGPRRRGRGDGRAPVSGEEIPSAPAITMSATIPAISGKNAERRFGSSGLSKGSVAAFVWAGTPTCTE